MNKASLMMTAILFALSCAARAETVNTTADLLNDRKALAYVSSRAMLEAMYRFGVEQDRKFGLQLDCKSQYNIRLIGMYVLSPIDFPESRPNPVKGFWMARYAFERCGDSKIYNMLFLANGNGEAPIPRAYYPGSTHAGPLLVKDAMTSAVIGALARSGLKDCKDVDVYDMRVTAPPHDVVEKDNTFHGVWNESWTFRMCGRTADVEMTFVPDASGGGTTFFSGPSKPADTTKP